MIHARAALWRLRAWLLICAVTVVLQPTIACGGEREESQSSRASSHVEFLVTTNGGKDYVRECKAAGVPLPDTVLDETAGWVNHGEVLDPFILDTFEAELWSWSSASPEGICLALPRWA